MNLNPLQKRHWDMVTASLEVFFNKDHESALALVEALTAKHQQAGRLDSDLTYHAEPIHVAEDLLNKRVVWTDKNEQRYALLYRLIESGRGIDSLLPEADSLSLRNPQLAKIAAR